MQTKPTREHPLVSALDRLAGLALYLTGVPTDNDAVLVLRETIDTIGDASRRYQVWNLADLARRAGQLAQSDLSDWEVMSDLDRVVQRMGRLARQVDGDGLLPRETLSLRSARPSAGTWENVVVSG